MEDTDEMSDNFSSMALPIFKKQDWSFRPISDDHAKLLVGAWNCKRQNECVHDSDISMSHIFKRLNNGKLPSDEPELFVLFRTKYLAFCTKFSFNPNSG